MKTTETDAQPSSTDPVLDRLGDVAALHRVRRTVGLVVVEGGMGLPPDQVVRRKAKGAGRRRVDEGDQAGTVDAVDPVADRVEQQLGLLRHLAQ